MKYGVEVTLGGMIYIPSFKKLSSGVIELLRGDTHRYTDIRDTHTDTSINMIS
jgi:hypothetical protein